MESIKNIIVKEKKLIIWLLVSIILFSLVFSIFEYCEEFYLFSTPSLFPTYKADSLFADIVMVLYSYSKIFLVASIITGLLSTVLIVLIIAKNRIYFNLLSITISIINVSVIPVTFYFGFPFMVFGYYAYLKFFDFRVPQMRIFEVIILFVSLSINFIFAILPVINSFSNVDNLKKIKSNLYLSIIGVIFLLLTIIPSLYYEERGKIDLSTIKGMELFNSKDQKWILALNLQHQPTHRVLQNYYEQGKYQYALNTNNLNIINSLKKEKFVLGTQHTYNLAFYGQNPLFERFCLNNIKQNSYQYGLEKGFMIMALLYKVNPDKESLKLFESMFHDEAMIYSGSSKCTLSLIEYKLGKLKDAESNSKFVNNSDISNDYSLCEHTQKLLSGKIKKTKFTGQLVDNHYPVKDTEILFTSSPEMLFYPIWSYIDRIQTDQQGKFTLYAETDQPINLIVISKEPKTISYDYKKLLNYKQGATIDLGKVVVK